jgi:selenocysteine lyase/cysteine desulfurase
LLGTTIDIASARADTPGVEAVLHFNNAGASLMPQAVLDAVTAHLELETKVGGYEAAEEAGKRIEGVYASAAALVGCGADEIALVDNATRAWDAIFYSLPFAAGDRVLTSTAEYGSNFIAYLQVAQRTGIEVVVIPNGEDGGLDVAALRDTVDERVRLISMTHIPTSGGLVNPAARVGEIAREADVLYLLDACQSVGQIPMDVSEIGCDFLATTGRKFLRGPRGTGFLYINRHVLERFEPNVLDVRSAEWVAADRYEVRGDARRFETWEASYALQLGLGAAIDYARKIGVDAIWSRVRELADRLRRDLSRLEGVRVHDRGPELCAIVTFTIEGIESEWLRAELAKRRINVWVSTPDDTRLDFEARELHPMVRASLHYFNTDEEIARFCEAVASLSNA